MLGREVDEAVAVHWESGGLEGWVTAFCLACSAGCAIGTCLSIPTVSIEGDSLYPLQEYLLAEVLSRLPGRLSGGVARRLSSLDRFCAPLLDAVRLSMARR